ncbi:type II secretion system secretin GspD [Lysobacter sp. SG-8]|uniref:Type II secretion system secretin GspD n=1 Tax=Marilutibacter penaei TaxID=2759900 RepID=A0A7W3U320_9GAMM|nr:type II secretion system secretin GspD [Lysobacter penaei]MBB1088009.1 type II secretion system secretin GspD [Lysobacter penaei]
MKPATRSSIPHAAACPTPGPLARPARPESVGRQLLLAATIVALLNACASAPVPRISRDADLGTPAGTAGTGTADMPAAVAGEPLDDPAAGPQPQIRRGTGQVLNQQAAAAPPPNLGATTGEATFNFEGESLHAVVKVILGDMLGQNYVIAPGVQGTVTLATPRKVSAANAMSLLEMVLGWNNARMVYADGRYNIVPADQAVAGNVAPRTGSPASARGFEVRAVPLRYISAEEMKKVLEPYARPNAIVSTDPARNIISIAGTRSELENYLRTIDIFDVDWLSGMSVGVFPIQSGKASEVVADLEKVFGEQSNSPVSGMFRFMPLDGANAVLVITPQAEYLDDIQQWLERIDSAGGDMQLFTYELKYIDAADLAERLSEVFGSGQRQSGGGGRAPSLMPGLDPVELESTDGGSVANIGGRSGSGMGSGSDGGSMSLGDREGGGNASVMLEVQGAQVGVSAVPETNSLLVRGSPSAWRSIRDVIERLDVMPMQVHIEAQIATVQLTGDLSYGVNWYFEQAVNAATDDGGAGLPSALGRTIWGDLAGRVTNTGFGWTFLGVNAAAVISALDSVSDVQMLQSPSLFVRNNTEASFNVGARIPIQSVTVDPGLGNSYGQVQYLETGTILKVRPRITRDGTVFLDIVQEISAPAGDPDEFGNVRIDTRKLQTEAAVKSGETVMLAGLINEGTSRGSSGLPGLSRIPVIGGLFGRQTSNSKREETIILITPRIVRDPQEARKLTDDYGRQFRALEPLNRTPDR